MKSLVLTGIAFLMITCAQGQSWKNYYDSTNLYWKSDWKKTVLLLEEAEKDVRVHLPQDHVEYLTVTTDLAVAYWNTNDYENADRLLYSSFRAQPEYYSSNHHTELLKTIHGLANWYLENGNTHYSKFYYSTITRNKLNASDSLLYYTAALNLISIYEKLNVPDSALQVWQSVTEHYPAKLRYNLPWMLAYSRLLGKSGHSDEALATLEQLKQKYYADRKNNRIVYAEILTLLGQVCLSTKEYSKSIASFKEAERILSDGDLSPEKMVEVREALARTYHLVGKYKQSNRYYHQVMLLAAKENGVQSHRYASIYFAYGESLFALGKYRHAIQAYENSLLLLQKHIPETDIVFVTLLKNLAASYTKLNDQHYAYVYLRWAYEMLDRSSLDHQPLAREVMNGLADAYHYKGDDFAAAEFYLEADQLDTTRN